MQHENDLVFQVDPEQAYLACVRDLCSCHQSPAQCLCPVLAAYSDSCVSRGGRPLWREAFRECGECLLVQTHWYHHCLTFSGQGVHCPAGQEYSVCGDSCSYSCHSKALNKNCTSRCVEGCACPEGLTLDADGTKLDNSLWYICKSQQEHVCRPPHAHVTRGTPSMCPAPWSTAQTVSRYSTYTVPGSCTGLCTDL